jgi:monodehydroascorbate reductase (NADH)
LFTPELAAFYEGYYEAKGVTIVKGPRATEFEKDESGQVSSNPNNYHKECFFEWQLSV